MTNLEPRAAKKGKRKARKTAAASERADTIINQNSVIGSLTADDLKLQMS